MQTYMFLQRCLLWSCSISKVELILLRWRDGRFYRLWRAAVLWRGERRVHGRNAVLRWRKRERSKERERHGHTDTTAAAELWTSGTRLVAPRTPEKSSPLLCAHFGQPERKVTNNREESATGATCCCCGHSQPGVTCREAKVHFKHSCRTTLESWKMFHVADGL